MTATPRPRHRPPPRPAPPVDAPEDEAGADLLDATTARLRRVLDMLAVGHTQEEIALAFGRDARTIRRWVGEAKRRQVQVLDQTSAKGFVAEALHTLSRSQARILRRIERADGAGDFRAANDGEKVLRQNVLARLNLLERVGSLHGVRVTLGSDDPAPGERQADMIRSALAAILQPDEPDEDAYWRIPDPTTADAGEELL